jgi:hypothetical protein
MPERYESIRDSVYTQLTKKGVSPGPALKRAKRIGAATFNKTRKAGEKPVTGHSK